MWKLKTETWEKVSKIDLSLIKNRLKNKLGWNDERIEQAVTNYCRFLYLCIVFPGARLEPTSDVDEVWHAHILHLKKYIDDCQKVCGRIIYHEPFSETVNGNCADVPAGECSGTTGCQESPPADCAKNIHGDKKYDFSFLSKKVFDKEPV